MSDGLFFNVFLQKKLNVYGKMQECMEQQLPGGGKDMLLRDQSSAPTGAESGRRASSVSELKDGAQPAEAEYLSSSCVLFTYFKGDIGDVVDEHFSRALSQASIFSSEAKPIRVTQSSASNNVWKGKKGKKSVQFRSSADGFVLNPCNCFRWWVPL